MYARVTSFQVDPARLPEMVAKIGELKSATKAMKGVVDTYVVWRADGQGVVTSVFESKAAADAAVSQAQAVWGGLAGLLKGGPKPEAFDNVAHLSG